MAPVQRRFDLGDLLGLAGFITLSEAAERSGIALRQWQRWKAQGGIPEDSADRAAARLGLHPVEVWPLWGVVEQPKRKVERRRKKAALTRVPPRTVPRRYGVDCANDSDDTLAGICADA